MAVKAFDFTVDKYEQTKEIYCEILKQFGIKNPEQHIESIVSKIPEAERNGEVFGTKIVAPLFKDDEDRKAKAKDVLGKILSNGEISREVKAYIAQMTLDFIPYDTVATAAIMVGEGNSLQMGCGEGKTGVLSAAAYKILENPNKQVFLTTSTPLLAAEALDQLPFYSALGMADQVVLVTEEGVTTPILDENGEITYTTKLNEEGEEEIVPATQLEPFAGKTEEQKAAMLKDAYSKRLVTSDNVSLMKHAMAGYLEKASSENDRVLLADEADFVLLDSYRPVQQTERMSKEESQKIWRTRQEAYAIAKEILKMEPKLYDMDDVNQYVDFTREGRGKVVSIIEDRYGNTKDGEEKNRLYDCIYDALRVETIYKEDRDYQVSKDRNEIISEDRAAGVNIDLPEGIKQAVEIKLKLEGKYDGPVSLENKVTDTLNVQEFFSSYFNKKQFISGTLGIDNKEILGELSRHFGVTKEDVFIIPPRGEGKRKDNGKHIYRNKEEKHQAIIKDTIAKIKEGRPVLIGVSKESELNDIEKALKEAGITQVPLIYNASSEKQFQKDKLSLSDEEFKAKYGKDVEKTTYKKYSTLIKKESGKTGRITLGTNIIGRGTTIKIKKDVNKLGGLHVISDGIHENGSRNPIQFVNRAGRGSDEGSSVEMFSLDDISEQYRPSIQGLKTSSEIYDAVYQSIDARTSNIREYVNEFVHYSAQEIEQIQEAVHLNESQKKEAIENLARRAFSIKDRALGISDRFKGRAEEYKEEIHIYSLMYMAKAAKGKDFDERVWLRDVAKRPDLADGHIPFDSKVQEKPKEEPKEASKAEKEEPSSKSNFSLAGIEMQMGELKTSEIQEIASEAKDMILSVRDANNPNIDSQKKDEEGRI